MRKYDAFSSLFRNFVMIFKKNYVILSANFEAKQKREASR